MRFSGRGGDFPIGSIGKNSPNLHVPELQTPPLYPSNADLCTDKDPNRVEVTIVMTIVISCVAVLVVMFQG